MGIVSKVYTVAPVGFEGHLVEVECDFTKGLPGFQLVGLGNKAIDEARERVKSAITNSLLEYPNRRMTVNLAPAELPKDGSLYDLAIALALLTCSGQLLQDEVKNAVFAGELALDGQLRPIKGVINIAETAVASGISTLYLPAANAPQASMVEGLKVYAVNSLKELFLHLKGEITLEPFLPQPSNTTGNLRNLPIIDEICGQEQAKRALIIAAAGHHNILFSGPPGAGKTMLAKALNSLLPPLSPIEQLAVTKVHSLAGESVDTIVTTRPFRAPHHTSSQISLIGGGTHPRPGEISLAHHGVLFLDEIPEYPRTSLEALRQPLEDKQVSITRAGGRATYPADFMLIATMNPCPCGYYGDSRHECSCSPNQIIQYRKKLSGPLLDRIDMTIQVSRSSNDSLLETNSMSNEQHLQAKKDILMARTAQHNRYKSSNKCNSSLSSPEVRKLAIEPSATALLNKASTKLNLSPRSYFKIMRVARTIADIESAPIIGVKHISEALQYRQL